MVTDEERAEAVRIWGDLMTDPDDPELVDAIVERMRKAKVQVQHKVESAAQSAPAPAPVPKERPGTSEAAQAHDRLKAYVAEKMKEYENA